MDPKISCTASVCYIRLLFPPPLMNQAEGKYNNGVPSCALHFPKDSWTCPDMAEFLAGTCKQARAQIDILAIPQTSHRRPEGCREEETTTKGPEGTIVKQGQTLDGSNLEV